MPVARGLPALCAIADPRAYRTNQYRGRAELRREWLRRGTEGLIALSGARHGDVGAALLAGNASRRVARRASAWAARFPDRYYLELQRAGAADDEALIARRVALASALRLPVVATHPVQFLEPDDFRAHEARVCIARGLRARRPAPAAGTSPRSSTSRRRPRWRSSSPMPAGARQHVEIAQAAATSTLALGKNRAAAFPTPRASRSTITCAHDAQGRACCTGSRSCILARPGARASAAIAQRLEFEIKTILQMGFAGYFLIVADFINWAKNERRAGGAGRGSGAGSLVAYSLGITDLDPLRYDLLFERFLNPERVSMPDFDIDFCQDGRDRVIDYVQAEVRRGERRRRSRRSARMAAQGRRARRRPRARSRLQLLRPDREADSRSSRASSSRWRRGCAQDGAARPSAEKKREDEVRELLELGETLEGLARNVGMHAGGVLIAPGKLTDFCPLYTRPKARDA